MQRKTVETRLDEDTIKRIDSLVSKKQFDNRASFIRRAVIDKLGELDKPILA